MLLGSVDDGATLLGGQLATGVLLDEGQELGLASLLPLAGHTTETDVGQVLEPLKVRDSNSSGVQQQVGDDDLALGDEVVVSIGGNGSVGSLTNDLGLDVLDVLEADLALEGGGDQDIALTLHDLDGSINDLGVAKATEGTLLGTVLEDGLDIDTVGVVGRDVVLTDTDDLGAVVLEELGSPVADVSESLDNDGLAGNVAIEAGHLLDLGELQELADTVVDTETGGLVTAADTSLGDGLAGDTSSSVDILGVELAVGVHDPGHLAGAGSDIGGGDIDTGSNEVLLAELHGVAAGDALELGRGELLGVELDASLGTTEGNIDDGALVGHEGSQGLDLLEIDLVRETNTSLAGKAMAGVLGTVTLDDDVGVGVNLDGELDGQDGIDGLDAGQRLFRDSTDLGSLQEQRGI